MKLDYIDLLEIGLRHSELYKISENQIRYYDIFSELDINILKELKISESRINEIVCRYKKYDPIKTKDKIYEVGAKIIYNHNDNFPKSLNNIVNKPYLLYYRGKEFLNGNNFAIVGSRMYSQYGENATKLIVPDLVSSGFIIVSGGAIGIDSIAHKEAINAGGKTIAIIGTGIDIDYPRSNKKIYENIIENSGNIISIFPIGTKPERYNFPIRNEIIAGISKGVLIVEAGEKSGTLITAKLALEQNKDVFVVPGDINKKSSVGANNIIKNSEGKLTTSAEDILEEYGIYKHIGNKKTIKFDDYLEEQIYNEILMNTGEIEELSENLQIPVEIISYRLTMMEIKKIIKLQNSKYSLF